MKTIQITWTGIRPLVMGNPQTIQVTNHYSVESRRINTLVKAARKRQDEDKLVELEPEQRKNDFLASAYFDDQGFYLPDTVVIACIKEAARSLKKGKDIDRGVLVDEPAVRIIPKRGHKTLDSAFADPEFRLECPCRMPPKTGTLIWKCRCMIPTGWTATFHLTFGDLIAEKALQEINEIAGRLVGVGGWRPRFGRFIVS